MADWFVSGRIVDLILCLMLAEALLLLLLRSRAGLRASRIEVLATIGAGAGLMLALRAALRGAPWTVVAAWLLAALGAHLVDMAARFGPGAAARSAVTPRRD